MHRTIQSSKQCIICWLPSMPKNPVQYLHNIDFFLTNCRCNVLVHHMCLRTWVKANETCPICRNHAYVISIRVKDSCIQLTKYILQNLFIRFQTIPRVCIICFYAFRTLCRFVSVMICVYMSFYFLYMLVISNLNLLDIDLFYSIEHY